MTAPKNLPASVRQRLLTLSQTQDIPFDLLLVRFAVERLLYRLTRTPHAGDFLLKGAMLFAVWSPLSHRPTRDVDLLGFGSDDAELIKTVFQTICQTQVEPDGLEFMSATLRVGTIREDNRYGGLRVSMVAKLGTIRIPVQIDIGYGDAVTPAAETVTFPPLLEFPAPRLRAYPIYTVVAEKFEAIVSIGEANTRMKDFYDLHFLAGQFEFTAEQLAEAIHATFARRRSTLPEDAITITGLSSDFVAARTALWAGFLSRNRLVAPPLAEVVERIRDFIAPLLNSAAASRLSHWKPDTGWLYRGSR